MAGHGRLRKTRHVLMALAVSTFAGTGVVACGDGPPTAQGGDFPSHPLAMASTTRAPIIAAEGHRSQSTPVYASGGQSEKSGARAYTPPSGSRERRELMDVIRLRTRQDLGTHAVFVVRNLRSDGQWAFAQLEPQHPDGSPIRPHTTPAYRDSPSKLSNNISIDAIWVKLNGSWNVYAYQIGARDVWWLAHCDAGAASVLPGC